MNAFRVWTLTAALIACVACGAPRSGDAGLGDGPGCTLGGNACAGDAGCCSGLCRAGLCSCNVTGAPCASSYACCSTLCDPVQRLCR